MPSRTTLKWLVAITLVASLFCFSVLAADADCGAQSWDCATFSGIAVVAVSAGLALGLFLTAVIVVLGWGVLLVLPMARVPEPRARAGRVALTLLFLHLLAFGALRVIGVLPMGWVWWLGAFGAMGMHSPGSTYMFVPPH